jgi:hypothetical protein
MFRKTHHDLGEGSFYQVGFGKFSLTFVRVVMRLSLAFKNQISLPTCCHPEPGEGLSMKKFSFYQVGFGKLSLTLGLLSVGFI